MIMVSNCSLSYTALVYVVILWNLARFGPALGGRSSEIYVFWFFSGFLVLHSKLICFIQEFICI